MKPLAVLSASAAALLLAIWGADRTVPVRQISNVILSTADGAPPPRPGEDLTLRSVVFRDRLCRTLLEHVVLDVNGYRFFLPDVEFEPATLGLDTYSTFLPVDPRAHPGPATLTTDLSWRCNPTHILFPLRTTIRINFVIAPPAPAAPRP